MFDMLGLVELCSQRLFSKPVLFTTYCAVVVLFTSSLLGHDLVVQLVSSFWCNICRIRSIFNIHIDG